MPDDTDSIALAENIRIGIKKGRIIIGTKILFFAMPNVNAEPKIPIDIKTGDPITNVEIIIKESFIDILKKIETRGINIIMGKHVNNQHEIIFRNKINSKDESDVRNVSKYPLL